MWKHSQSQQNMQTTNETPAEALARVQGELLGLLQAAAGEGSLHSKLGQWRQRVNKLVGEATEIATLAQQGQSQASLPDYGWAKRGGSAQVGVGLNSLIDLVSVGPTRGISYANARWTLNPGKTYVLRALGYFDNFSDATGGFMDVKFTDDANVPLTGPTADSPTGRFRPTTSTTTNSGSASGLEMIYQTPPAFSGLCIVKLRITAAQGTADVPQSGFTMTVEEIPGGA